MTDETDRTDAPMIMQADVIGRDGLIELRVAVVTEQDLSARTISATWHGLLLPEQAEELGKNLMAAAARLRRARSGEPPH